MKCSAEGSRGLWLPLVLVAATQCGSAAGWAQSNQNQWGSQDRADAAARTIVLAVQQGIDALPPTSGQSFTWTFDPRLEVPVRGRYLGPTVLRAPDTIGRGRLALRVATSYFDLDDTLGPIDHQATFLPPFASASSGYVKFGSSVSAKVGVVNMAATYGLTGQWDVTMNLPVVIVDAEAAEIFSASTNPSATRDPNAPQGGSSVDDLNQALRQGVLSLRRETFTAFGNSFPEGTHTGVGRISVGVKGVAYSAGRLTVAVAPEFFFPSPSQGQLAGSATAAILPRAVADYGAADRLRLYLDVGYDYDFNNDELRSFVWHTGASIPGERVTFDLGVGGSKFNSGVVWTPPLAKAVVWDAGDRHSSRKQPTG